MKKQIIHTITSVDNKNNNYSEKNILETRKSDGAYIGEYEGSELKIKLKHVLSEVTEKSNYSFRKGIHNSIINAYNHTEIEISTLIIKEFDEDIACDNITVVGTDKKIVGFTIILKAIPNENFSGSYSKVFLSDHYSPYSNTYNYNFPLLTLLFYLPIEEIKKHIEEINLGNSATYEIVIDKGVYKSIETESNEYKVFPDNILIYEKTEGTSRLEDISFLDISYIKKYNSLLSGILNIFKFKLS